MFVLVSLSLLVEILILFAFRFEDTDVVCVVLDLVLLPFISPAMPMLKPNVV
ncbi:hypothetical protein LMG7974_01935 [Campylobacter majalis]|uniref:Uncharacterized protein n=1 Tax=Campylobacter majalis TaxID=2790656 RepID=A0ABM8QA37_9BACT|nr:hypothetical protein LMG7974_01935 [Campylobacter majalis]